MNRISITCRRFFGALCALSLCLSVIFPVAAHDGGRFRQLTTGDGLADNTVWTVCQDRTGFIWMGTADGLYRYDGSLLRAVRRNFPDGRGRGNSVTSLAEDTLRRLMWAGTDAGLFAWDMRCDTLMRPQWPEPACGLLSREIVSVATDRRHRLLVAVADSGLYRIGADRDENIFSASPLWLLDSADVCDLQTDSCGTIWIVTRNHGVMRYDDSPEPEPAFDGVVGMVSFLKDADGTVWAGAYDGLWRQDAADAAPRRIELREEPDASRLSVNHLLRRDGHTLCLATSHGLFLYDTETGRSTRLKSEVGVAGSLNCDYLNRLFIDRERTLWIATYFGGINYLPAGNRDISSYDFLNYRMQGHVVSAFAEDLNGDLWIGTEDGGMSRYDPATGAVTNMNPKTRALNVPNFHNIHALMAFGEYLWVGMASGAVDVLHIPSGRSRHIGPDDGLLSSTVYAFGHDRGGGVWIGTTAGLNRCDPETFALTAETGVPARRINCIAEDGRGNLWVCGEELGVYCRPAGSRRWVDFRQERGREIPPAVYTLECVGDLVYIGTRNEGVFCYDAGRRELSRLPLTGMDDQIVYRMVADGNDLWISTGKGLLRYNHLSGSSELYDTDNGLKTEQMNINAGMRTADGTLFFGTVAGLNGFRPGELTFNPHAPEVVATRLYIDNVPVEVAAPESPLECSITYADHLTLDRRHTGIGIRFAALTYTGSASYLYRLEPFDREWIPADASEPVAVYANLPAGEYTFRVRACNGDGVWNDAGYSLGITVRAPWWASWPVLAGAGAMAIAGCGMALWLRRRRVKRAHVQAPEPIVAPEAGPGPAPSTQADAEFIGRVDEIIDRHMADSGFTVATMLRELVMSRTAFFTRIKAESGMTFSDYVRLKRLTRAAELFRKGDTYVSDVAYRTGFSSPSYFCNCFRRHFGVTPSEYIRNCGSSEQ